MKVISTNIDQHRVARVRSSDAFDNESDQTSTKSCVASVDGNCEMEEIACASGGKWHRRALA